MQAGKLRRKFTILECTETNTSGSVALTYAPASPAKAFYGSLEGADGIEVFDASVDRTEQRYTISARYRTDLTAKKRLRHGDQDYQILTIADPDGRRKEIAIKVVVLG